MMADLILPDPRMEMPELFEPGRKPVGPVVIDWSQNIMRDCIAYVINGTEITNHKKLTFSGAYIDGLGDIRFNGISTNHVTVAGINPVGIVAGSHPVLTFICVGRFSAAGSLGSRVLSVTATGQNAGISLDQEVYNNTGDVGGTSAAVVNTSSEISTPEKGLISVSFRGAAEWMFCVNGALSSKSASIVQGNYNNGAPQMDIGATQRNGSYIGGTIDTSVAVERAIVFDRALSDGELKTFAANHNTGLIPA